MKEEVENLARVLWADFVDQQGYPNGLMTWDEMLSVNAPDLEQFRSYARAAMSYMFRPLGSEPVTIEHDGFYGYGIGRYITREAKKGVVLQMVGTKIVHVYGEKWIEK